MTLTPELFVIVPLVVFTAYFVYGLSGFGSALVNVSILAHFLPLTIVVPASLLLDFSASAMVGFRFHRDAQWRELLLVGPFAFIGMLAGVVLLINLPREQALLGLGVLVGFYGAYTLVRPHRLTVIRRIWAVPMSLVGGALSGLFGTGGPVFVIYLSRRILEPLRLKATLAALLSFQGATRIVAYLITGLLLQPEVLIGALALFPVMWIALRMGVQLHARLSRDRVVQVMSAVLLATGVTLVLRAMS